MTEEQKKMLVAKIDAAANKDIPKSAWWHMRHRPYSDDTKKEDGGSGGRRTPGRTASRASRMLHSF